MTRPAQILSVLALLAATGVATDAETPPTGDLVAVRIGDGPIIHAGLFPEKRTAEGNNLNGPWLIRVPQWVNNPLGKYYLYFAHHHGQYIRMAYADVLAGPWKLYKPGRGVLHLSQQTLMNGHLASPFVIVDKANKRLVLYFHGGVKRDDIPETMRDIVRGQATSVATSTGGLSFAPTNKVVCDFYLYAFDYRGAWYGMGRWRNWWRTEDLLAAWQPGPRVLEQVARATEPDISHAQRYAQIRHVAFLTEGERLTVIFSCTQGAPERLFYAEVPLKGDWRTWRATTPARRLLAPRTKWEGAASPPMRSRGGISPKTLYPAIQDPMVFTDSDGKRYLVYVGGGEKAIGIAELKRHTPQ